MTINRSPVMDEQMRRPTESAPRRPATHFCPKCESTVISDYPHSCYDAKALREQQERERALNEKERAVVEAAKRWVAVGDLAVAGARLTDIRDEFHAAGDKLRDAVRALDAEQA